MRDVGASVLTPRLIIMLVAITGSMLGGGVAAQEIAPPTPKNIGVVYLFDRAQNSLTSLQRQTGISKRRGVVSESRVIQFDGTISTVRVDQDRGTDFVISLSSGMDPSNYRLFRLEVTKESRQLVLARATVASALEYEKADLGLVQVPIDISRFGEAYKLSPSQPLTQGEYAFFRRGSNEAFCFGVDVRAAEKQPE